MTDPWDEDLTDEETDRLLERVAAEVRRRRLETPAILALELHRPLAGLGSGALVVLAPFAGPLFGPDNVRDLSRLLRKKGNVEKLLERLECRGD